MGRIGETDISDAVEDLARAIEDGRLTLDEVIPAVVRAGQIVVTALKKNPARLRARATRLDERAADLREKADDLDG